MFLVVTAAVVSANRPFHAGATISKGIQSTQYPTIPSLVWRGGAQPWHRQPPPPPPPPPPRHGPDQSGQDTANEREKHELPNRIPPPPPQPPEGKSAHQSGTPPRYPNELQVGDAVSSSHNLVSPKSIPPPPKQRATAAVVRTRKPPPPPPPISLNVKQQQNEPSARDVADESVTHERGLTDDKVTTIKDRSQEVNPSPPVHFAIDDEANSQRTSNAFLTTRNRRRDMTRADSGSDILFLVPPKDELNRISLQTALSGRPQRDEQMNFSNLIQFRQQHMAMEKLLVSQHFVQKEMIAIAGLLRELLAQQQKSKDALVVHVPRPMITTIPPRKARRRVEKVRKVPRKTILSSIEELDHDLSDGEFDMLLHGLHQPSEVEEVYHEYEYDEEYPWHNEVQSHATLMTPNAEEVNAFLRESSESDSWQSVAEASNRYDSDIYYDDYYDEEPLEEFLKAWSGSDADASMSALSEEGEPSSHLDEGKEDVATSSETLVSPARDIDAGSATNRAVFVDNASLVQLATEHQESQPEQAKGTKASSARSQLRQLHPPPPPPRRFRKSQRQSGMPHATDQTPSFVSTPRANEGGQRQPPPPPPRPQPPPVHIHPMQSSTRDPVFDYSYDEEQMDLSDDFDEVELRLLEETAVDVHDFEDYDDTVDEDDLRILQLSRWPSFAGRKEGGKLENEDDLVVDDDVYLDGTAGEDVATDDFTDFEQAEPLSESLPSGTVLDGIVEEPSEDEMLLGESAVAESFPSYGLLRPPPPPPPRPSTEDGASAIYLEKQQQPTSFVERVARPGLTIGAQYGTLPYSYQIQAPPPVPPTAHPPHTAGDLPVQRAMQTSNVAQYANPDRNEHQN